MGIIGIILCICMFIFWGISLIFYLVSGYPEYNWTVSEKWASFIYKYLKTMEVLGKSKNSFTKEFTINFILVFIGLAIYITIVIYSI